VLQVNWQVYGRSSLTFRDKCRLRDFENRVLRRIFEPKRNEVTAELTRQHNKELYALYFSPNIFRVIESRRLRWAWQLAKMRESIGAYGVLVGILEGRRPLERPRSRWEDHIKMNLREMGWGQGLNRCS
jgi:hypothetical protein